VSIEKDLRSIFTALMNYLKKVFFCCLLICSTQVWSQYAFSIATDLSLLRSFSPKQSFTAIGQTIQFQNHFTPTETGYALVCYYSPGKYSNSLTATAKDPSTTPGNMEYTVHSKLRFRQISLGWKHYFIGSSNTEGFWNLYGSAGFGLVAAKVENNHEPIIDTALYQLEDRALSGTGDFKRLTFDLGVGGEIRIAYGIFLYADLRTWIPASSNPSRMLYNDKAPRVGTLNGGIRILFD
jgi:hypothetical protein